MARPEIPLGDYVIAAVLQAMESDPSRDAVSDVEGLKKSVQWAYRPPSPFNLRRKMMQPELRDALQEKFYEIASYVYPLETYYVIDATEVKSRYFRKWIKVKDARTGRIVPQKVKVTKIFLARGLRTGMPVAFAVTDQQVNDQTQTQGLIAQIVSRGGTIQGGGIIADCGFNARINYGIIKRLGGRGFLDFDENAVHSQGEFPEYDEMFEFRNENPDDWFAVYDLRNLIEDTNHAVKSVKCILRAQNELSRECEVLALLVYYSLSRLPELRLKYNLEIPFLGQDGMRVLSEAVAPKRQKSVVITSEIDLLPEMMLPMPGLIPSNGIIGGTPLA